MASEDRDDHDLLAAWSKGDKAAGSALVRRHFASVYRFFRTKLPYEAEDMTQRAFLAAVEGRDRLRGAFRPYLFSIARRQLLDHLRQRYRKAKVFDLSENSMIDLAPALATTPSRAVARRHEQQLLLAAMQRLPVDFQIAVELYYWEGMPLVEIAQVQDVAHGTVKSRLGRARALLKEQIESMSGDPRIAAALNDLDGWTRSAKDAVIDANHGERGPGREYLFCGPAAPATVVADSRRARARQIQVVRPTRRRQCGADDRRPTGFERRPAASRNSPAIRR